MLAAARTPRPVIPILVDERRLAAGLDAALATLTARAASEIITPAAFLERLTGVRVVGAAERRAIVRRIAATRDDVALPPHVRASSSFAARVVAALDETGERTPFETLIEHYRTLLAFANVLDVPDALHRALAGERRPVGLAALRIDAALLTPDDDRGFAWRRLCAAVGIALETIDLGPLAAPVIEPALVSGVGTILAYAATESGAAARRALLSRISGVGIDDARALLTACAGRTPLLDFIDSGKVALGGTARADAAAFARGLRGVVRAYCAPDAGASTVLAAIGAAFTLDHDPTVAALIRVARDFDRARTLGPQWDADELCAEFAAEFAGARAPSPAPFASEPAAPARAERARPVAVKRMHFSASSLNAYAECARKWYFRYVCAAVEDRGSSASFYGTAFHAALEEFHLRYMHAANLDLAETAAYLDTCVSAAFERYRGRFDAPVEFELQRRRARRTAKRYAQWLVERARRAPFEVIGCEVATELDLEGHAFVGYIDRLDRDERTGNVTVVDYKTGSIATSAAQYRADVAAFREFQLPFYYWARTAAGDQVTRLALIPLKDALLDVAPIELEITRAEIPDGGRRNENTVGTISVGELERARTKMIEYAGLLSRATLAAYPATDDPEACRYCAYKDGCRERPLVVAERFGR
jgi:RecB family exonuclease